MTTSNSMLHHKKPFPLFQQPSMYFMRKTMMLMRNWVPVSRSQQPRINNLWKKNNFESSTRINSLRTVEVNSTRASILLIVLRFSPVLFSTWTLETLPTNLMHFLWLFAHKILSSLFQDQQILFLRLPFRHDIHVFLRVSWTWPEVFDFYRETFPISNRVEPRTNN